MAVDIGTLSAKAILDPTQFLSGMDKIRAQFGKWAGFLGVALPSIGTGLAVGKIIGTIKELENVGDAAAAAGVSVGDFMRVTGRLDSEDTAAASQALEKMSKALGELSGGSKEARDKFADVGLDPLKLQALGTAGAVEQVAKAYMEATDPAQKAAIAFSVFGKAATGIIPAMDKLASMPADAGGKFAGMTEGMIASAARAKEAITTIENAWTNFWNTISVALVEAPDDMANFWNAMTEAPPEGKHLGIFKKTAWAWDQMRKARDANTEEAADASKRTAAERAVNVELEKQRKVHEQIDKFTDSAFAAQNKGVPEHMFKARQLRNVVEDEFGFGKVPADIQKRLQKALEVGKSTDWEVFHQSLHKIDEEMEKSAATFGMHAAEVAAWTARFDAAKLAAKTGIPVHLGEGNIFDKLDEAARKARATDMALKDPLMATNALAEAAQRWEKLNDLRRQGILDAKELAAAERALARDVEQTAKSIASSVVKDLATPLQMLDAFRRELALGQKAGLPQAAVEEAFGKKFKDIAQQYLALTAHMREPSPVVKFGTAEESSFIARAQQEAMFEPADLNAGVEQILTVIREYERLQTEHMKEIGRILDGRLPRMVQAN